MALNDGEFELLAKSLSDSAIQNDTALVGKLLGFQRKSDSPSIDQPLLLCSSMTSEDLQRLLLNEDNFLSRDTSLEYVIKSLIMMCPSIYETPWQTACQFIQYVNQNKIGAEAQHCTLVRSTVANIQTFLQRTIAFWWEEERKRTAASTTPRKPRTVKAGKGETLSSRNPRHWIVELVTVVVTPLLVPASQTKAVAATDIEAGLSLGKPSVNECWTGTLDLISTIVSLSNDVEVPLLGTVLDFIFQNEQSIRPDRFLSWFTTAVDLRLFLRDSDWVAIRSRVRAILNDGDPCPFPRQELPGLAQSILSLSTMEDAKANSETVEWYEILLLLLSVSSSTDLGAFSTVEAVLKSNLASLPSNLLMKWTDAITDTSRKSDKFTSFKSKWTLANFYLLVLRAGSGSNIVSRLVAKAINKHARSEKSHPTNTLADDGLHVFCWEQLVRLILPKDCLIAREEMSFQRANRQSKPTNESIKAQGLPEALKSLKEIFGGTTYNGKGRFTSHPGREKTAEILTAIGSTVFHSLVLENDGNLPSSQLLHALERGQAWIHCARKSFEHTGEATGVVDYATVIVIYVTVFYEIPLSRSSLVRSIAETILSETNFGSNYGTITSVYSQFFSIILGSPPNELPPGHGIFTEWDQITGVFAQPLPLSAFSDLSWALSSLPSARRALFAVAQKVFDSTSYAFGSYAAETSMRESMDQFVSVKRGLVSLVVLVSTSRWDENDVGAGAWCLLSKLIVENRPVMPLQARAWLFKRLCECAKTDIFKWVISRHLLRACTVRLLDFIACDKHGRENFSFENAFMHWGDGRSKQVEDLVGLFHLIFCLLKCRGSENTMVEEERIAAWAEGRRVLSCIMDADGSSKKSNKLSIMVNLCDTSAPSLPLLDTDEGFVTYSAFYCLALAEGTSSDQLVFDGMRIPSRDISRAILVEQESKELRTYLNSESLPSWLTLRNTYSGAARSCVAQVGWQQYAMTTRLGLYNLIASVIMDTDVLSVDTSIPDASLILSDARLRLALQMGEVFSRRRQLNNHLHRESDVGSLHQRTSFRLADLALFFTTVVPIVVQSLSGQSEETHVPTDVVQLLLAITDAADMVNSYSSKERKMPDRWMPCLWQVYSSLCDQNSVSNLDEHLLRHVSETDSNPVDPALLQTQDDVDRFICRLRTSILNAVSSVCTHYHNLLQQQSFNFETHTRKRGFSGYFLSYFRQLVDKLVSDLHASLLGTYPLDYNEYLAFTDCIEKCTVYLIKAVPVFATIEEAQSVLIICRKALNSLEKILCVFVLKDVLSFKKTMTLFARILPALARCANRASLLLTGGDTPAGPTSVATCAFEQLTSILKRRAEAIFAPGAQWREIVGLGHLSETAGDDNDDMEHKEDGIVGEHYDSFDLVGRSDSAAHSRSKLLLWSERTWDRSVICILDAFECNWEESNRLLVCSRDVFDVKASSRQYYRMRKTELLRILECLCPLFETVPSHQNSDSTSVYAMSLPNTTKSKLIGTIDRIFIVLQKSFNCLISRIRSDQSEDVMSELTFLESLSCITSWLEMACRGFELSSGIQTWYLAEKKAANLKANVAYSTETPVLRCLPKLIFRVEDVEFNLRKLSRELRFASKSTSSNKPSTTRTSEIHVFLDRLVSDSNADCRGAFSSLVSNKLAFIAREQSRVNSFFGLTPASKKRKSGIDIGSHIRKERRRRVIRSRNKVVDEWLQKDATIGGDDAQNYDAFADLEDFVADG